MNKILIIIAIALIGIFTIIYVYSNNKNVSGEIIQDLEPQGSDEIKEFTMTARKWKFEPNEIIVNKGDKVRLTVTSIDMAHGIAISDYGINEYLSPGQTVDIEFTADKKGRFPFVCSVSCGIGHRDMRGILIVN